jgi:hypothetical protein
VRVGLRSRNALVRSGPSPRTRGEIRGASHDAVFPAARRLLATGAILAAFAGCDGGTATQLSTTNPEESVMTSPSPDSQVDPTSGAVTTDPDAEASDGGWQDLFDGRRTIGLRGYNQSTFPSAQWHVDADRLTTVAGPGVDLVTETAWRDFEVQFSWIVTPGGNSGVIYRVKESDQPSWVTGPEYQVLDDDRHPDGRDPATSAGSLYGLITPNADKELAPAGEENHGRIVVRGGRVEHWLNERLVVAYEWNGADVRAAIAASKFAELDGFMGVDEGHVVLQHHGEEVAYTRVRIRGL